MSFFHALYTGTAGMLAQERSTNVISENIANSTTTGYKRMNTAFHELVATNKNSVNQLGSVYSSRINRISQQGTIQNTSSITDIAIGGKGLFPVRASIDDPTAEMLYTRNGSFSPDKDGLLRNSAGFILYGWPITNGVAAGGTDITSLQPIDTDELQNTSVPTTFAAMRLNLDANQQAINPHTIGTGQQLPVSNQASHFTRSIEVYDANGTARQLTLELRATTGPMAHFSSRSNMASSTGMNYSDVLVDPAGPTPSIADGDTLDINGNVITFRAANPIAANGEVSTFQELIGMINSFTGGGGEQLYTARRDERGELTVQANDPTVTIDLTGSDNNVLAAGGLGIIQDPDAAYTPDSQISNTGGLATTDVLVGLPATPAILDGDNLQLSDGVNTLNITFRAAGPLAANEVSTVQELIDMVNNYTDGGGNPVYTAAMNGTELEISLIDPAATLSTAGSSGNVLGANGLNLAAPVLGNDYIYEPDASLTADGLANPNQTAFPGFFNATSPNPYHWWEMRVMTADPAAPNSGNLVEISKGLINFNGDGSINATADANGQMLIDLGDIDFDGAATGEETAIQFDISGFTQAAGNYQVLFAEQNGTPLGSFTGVEITTEGIVQAVFSNGQRVDVHQIALAQFANPDGLERVSGTAFRVTQNSGEPEVFAVGDGGTGKLTVSGLETSNVDIAEEFSSLIVNQRAYSLNSRVITAVDEMTQNLAQLKR